MADLEAVLADVSYLMAMEKSKCTPAARASKKIVLPDPRWVIKVVHPRCQPGGRLLPASICRGLGPVEAEVAAPTPLSLIVAISLSPDMPLERNYVIHSMLPVTTRHTSFRFWQCLARTGLGPVVKCANKNTHFTSFTKKKKTSNNTSNINKHHAHSVLRVRLAKFFFLFFFWMLQLLIWVNSGRLP